MSPVCSGGTFQSGGFAEFHSDSHLFDELFFSGESIWPKDQVKVWRLKCF